MNPFTERGRITRPERFAGRWREVSQIFERLERRRPVVLIGAPGAGKSSILTHIAQSAGAVLEMPQLLTLFLDLALLPDAETAYRLILRELRFPGDSHQQLATALTRNRRPLLICLDGLDSAIAAGWGSDLIERMARMARSATPSYAGGIVPPDAGLYDLMLVAAAGNVSPAVSEPLATVTVGAVSASEVRLFAEAYLESGEVQFSSEDIRELQRVSGGHPAYLQRAAYHLYRAHREQGYNWRAAFAEEAREQPIIGAPLPPEAFYGEAGEAAEHIVDDAEAERRNLSPAARWMTGPGSLLPALAPFVIALIVLQFSRSWIAALIILLLGYLLVSRLPG